MLNWAYWCVANDCIYRGLMREAREWAWTLLNAGRDREDQRALGLAHATLGMIHLIGGEFHKAVRNADEAVRTALTPFDRTYGSAIKAMAEQSLLGAAEGGPTRRPEMRREMLERGLNYFADTQLGATVVVFVLAGKINKGIRLLESAIEASDARGHSNSRKLEQLGGPGT